MKIDKAAIKSEFQRHDRDTGSSEVQIAILTKEIEALTAHLKANKKDHSSRYGLLRKVQNRRSLLDYLKRENEASYKELIKKLGIRRSAGTSLPWAGCGDARVPVRSKKFTNETREKNNARNKAVQGQHRGDGPRDRDRAPGAAGRRSRHRLVR